MKRMIFSLIFLSAAAAFFQSISPEPASLSGQQEEKIYHNQKYGFSLRYPALFSVDIFPEETGETIVFEDFLQGAGGFQIFVSRFSGDPAIELTPERILADNPSEAFIDPRTTIVGEGIKAISFFGAHPEIGKTYEVAFLHGGYLYSVTTYAGRQEWLNHILSTWRLE